jgi:site-specific DNA recombinase
VPVHEEAKAVVKAFELYTEGMKLLGIATKLHALGFLPHRGKKLSAQSIHNWLTNPVYIAKILSKHFPDQQIDAVHEPIIAVSLWNKVQRRLVGKGPATRQKFNPAFPLTTILRCYKCNTPLTASFSRGKSGKQYAYY